MAIDKIIDSSLELIGKTPMLNAARYAAKAEADKANILVKLEYLNPTGSAKDRAALSMIEEGAFSPKEPVSWVG